MKIVLVEDSRSVAATIEMYLTEEYGEQLSFERAASLAAAVDVLERSTPDVVLLDLGLPDSEGLDTLKSVRARFPDIPVVVLTAASDEQLALAALRLGAQDYIFKSDANQKLLNRSIRYAVERKYNQVKLAESEKKHRTLLEVLPEIVYEIDTGGIFRYVNRSIELIGYSPQELIGQHFSLIVHPEDVNNISRVVVLEQYHGKHTGDAGAPKLFDERRTKHRMTRDLSVRLVPKGANAETDDGCIVGSLTSYGELSVTGLYDTNRGGVEQQFIGSVGVIRDITERIQAEQKRKALEKQLLQSQKMEAIGRLAGGVAHDMNNVLGAILGSAASIDMEMAAHSSMRVDLENIQAACLKGRDLTRDLLGFARKGKNINRPFSANKVIIEVSSLVTRLSLRKVDLVLALDEDLEYVEGDPDQVHHALMNVCVNSLDAMPQKGRLTITTKNVSIDEVSKDASEELTPGRYVEIAVSDTGVGMDEETLRNAFEPFFTTKPDGEGTGLGLSMVYGMVKNHGGAIDIRSAPREGTTVVIRLPSASFSAIQERREAQRKTERGGESRTILVVDDEQTVRTSLKRLLRKIGYDVLLAENGEIALEVFSREREVIGLIILDIIMPVMDGSETFARLTEMDPDIKILLMSGYAKDQKVEDLLKAGALGFVAKPFELRTMTKALQDAGLLDHPLSME